MDGEVLVQMKSERTEQWFGLCNSTRDKYGFIVIQVRNGDKRRCVMQFTEEQAAQLIGELARAFEMEPTTLTVY